MAFIEYSLLAELGKLSQGKETAVSPEVIAHLAIVEIRSLEKTRHLEDLERMFLLPDLRA
jgi:hypothetical protein